MPAVIGNDVSGVVVETGPGVDDFQPGDEVWYLAPLFAEQGTYAEFHVIDQALVARKPARLSPTEAAGLALVGVTVWEALVERAALQAGERVLVHSGAGGVGSAAVQVAAALGAEVVTTARARDHEFLTGLGAHVTIDFSTGDYVAEVRGLGGADVVLDTVGGDTLARSAEALADRGRVVSIVDISRPQNLLAAWGINATYHYLFVSPGRAELAALGRLIDQGGLQPVIGAVMPLADIPRAHTLLEGGAASRRRERPRGKIVINLPPCTEAPRPPPEGACGAPQLLRRRTAPRVTDTDRVRDSAQHRGLNHPPKPGQPGSGQSPGTASATVVCFGRTAGPSSVSKRFPKRPSIACP